MMRYLIAGIVATLAAIFLLPVLTKFGKWMAGFFKDITEEVEAEADDPEDEHEDITHH